MVGKGLDFGKLRRLGKLICGLGSNEDGGDLVLGIKLMKTGNQSQLVFLRAFCYFRETG